MSQLNFHNPEPPPNALAGNDLPILQKLTATYKVWHALLPKLPRHSRYSLGLKIDLLFTDLIELILRGSYTNRDQKQKIILEASNKLDALKFFLQLVWELKSIEHKDFIAVSQPLTSAGNMLGGWLKQLNR